MPAGVIAAYCQYRRFFPAVHGDSALGQHSGTGKFNGKGFDIFQNGCSRVNDDRNLGITNISDETEGYVIILRRNPSYAAPGIS